MPTVHANGIDIYYEVQGEGEPTVLIPYLAADQTGDATPGRGPLPTASLARLAV